MISLTPVKIDALLRGASVLSCGGGLKSSEQKRLAKGKKVKLISPSELRDGDWCAAVSEVGAAAAPPMVKTKLPQAIKLLEAKTGRKISALIPPEIGQEAIVIDAANIVGLPIVDSDLAGCRAVPRLDNSALLAQGVQFTMSPAVVLTQAGSLRFIPQQTDLKADENRIRRLVPTGQVITLVGGMVAAKTVRRYLNYHSYSTAMAVGKTLKTGRSLVGVLPNPLLLGPKPITVKAIKAISSRGFDSKIVTLVVDDQREKLMVENEYMSLKFKGQEFAFPQLIMIFDRRLGRGIHSSELTLGRGYDLIVTEAFPFWKEKKI